MHRGESAQRDRVLLLARDGLVRARSQLINQVRVDVPQGAERTGYMVSTGVIMTL